MDLYEILDRLEVAYEQVEHSPVYTVAEAMALGRALEGTECKNLFLRGQGRYFLAILPSQKQADLKAIARSAGVKRLSFAGPDELEQLLGLHPGSVSPFGVIHDTENRVALLLDRDLEGRRLLFHPNVNTKTLSIGWADLLRFFADRQHSWQTGTLSKETEERT